MPNKVAHITAINGLSEGEVHRQREKFGTNSLKLNERSSLAHTVWNIVREPMFIMLVVACLLYFLLGQPGEGFLMLAAMLFVGAISVYQELKSTKAIQALQALTDPKVTVIRSGVEKQIAAAELVPGDVMLLEEGVKIPADARLVQENDLTINESIITGESLPVSKTIMEGNDSLYQGTVVNSGTCYAKVTATGNATFLGKLGRSITTVQPSKTLLQQQIESFLKRFTLFGVVAFFAVFLFNYFSSHHFITSLLAGLTLAMSVLPEEIPVAFSSFMALGAYYMSKLGIITKQPQVVENLGAVSVICLDKTGTITENKMQVDAIYDYERDLLTSLHKTDAIAVQNVLWYAALASEDAPFDPMEKAIGEAYRSLKGAELDQRNQVYEYALEGHPPMMTHVHELHGEKIVAAKGAIERIASVCQLAAVEQDKVFKQAALLASKGSRVIGVASAVHTSGELPARQDDFNWRFRGLVSLYDPPKKHIEHVLQQFSKAGITVKLLTGDYPGTALNIAHQVGMATGSGYMTGDQVMSFSKSDLQKEVQEVNIFARMYPDAKRSVIEMLKADGEIVAMTGDGVNDGPALKAADIGIAMGGRGTEIARHSADLVLTDDNLQNIVEAIRYGRKTFSNLKKAVRYILSIHIPIILTASLPVILGWRFPNIFTPIHIIFLELIMGPTCSIFFEREPVEKNILELPPRKRTASLFSRKELLVSCLQGVVIATTLLLLYHNYMNRGYSLPYVRTIVFVTIIISNILLTFVVRSFTEGIFKTMRYRNNLAMPIVVLSACFLILILTVPFIRDLFGLSLVHLKDLLICVGWAIFAVLWFELYKVIFKIEVS